MENARSSLLPVIIDPVKAVSAFKSQRGKLSTIIRNDLTNIAHKLYANSIIPQKTLDEAINNSLGKDDRTVALLRAIEAKIKVQPLDFTKLVNILDSEPYLSTLAEGLVHNYNTSQSEDSPELDENERKAIFDEAMRFGHIDVTIIKILIVGARGVGKSSLLRFLCDLPVLDTYNSTTLINAAQRVKCNRVQTNKDDSSDEIVWELVGAEKLRSVLADAIKSRAAKVSSSQVFLSPSNVGSLQSSEPESTETSSLESISEVVGLLKYKGGKLFSVTWIYLVDSGGHPQFHELLTAFVRNATLCIFVFNLSEQLDDKPETKYYKNGQPCGESYKFPLSHKEIFQHCVQTISSLCPIDRSLPSTDSIETEGPTVTSSKFIKPEILVVGTHRKEEDKSKESREEKEEKLKEILQPYDAGVIKNAGKYIFPVDSISRSDSDKVVRNNIRRGIKAVKPFCKTALPLQYYALELELELQAKKKRCDVISFERCFREIGPSLNFSRKTFLAAISYLDQLNLILYFESQAPDLIFTNPNALLDKVGEIVEKSYIWRGKVPSNEYQRFSMESVLLVKRGVVTLEMLKSFESSYVEGLFDHITLTRILTHLFVLLPISKDKYFMPALLDVNEDLTSPTEDYLAVSFPDYAPMGLFSSSVVCLLSKYKWEEMNTPGHLFRNSLTFKVDIAQVTLLDKRTHFEVHIKISDIFKKVLPKLRARIREDVINAVNEVKEARHLYNLKYSSKCFCCPCSSSPPHLAEYKFSKDAGNFILDCTKDRGFFPVENWHKEWLAPFMEDVTIEKGESEPSKYRANTQLPQPLSSDHSTELPEGLVRRPQRSWQDRIPDAHLGNGSNEEKETIREHEGHASSSPSEKPKERYKFKLTEGLIRRPQRSWQDRIPDAHLGNGSNEERETIREHEGHASSSPSEKPKERHKFKLTDKRILCGFVVLMIILAGVATGFLYIKLNTNATTGLSLWREPSTGHNTQPIHEEPSAGPSTTPADRRKVKQPKDKEYTPELIESCEDVEKVLKKVNPDYAPYKRMCRYLLKKETCNELIGKNELDVHNIAMYYFQQHPYLYWHDLISILCNQFGENRLASDVAKKHGVSYEKYCPTA